MMDDQQMRQISAWLDNTMTEEEMEQFRQARENDPELDRECLEMQALLGMLSEIDRDLQPSAQFHGNVMKRLEAECMTEDTKHRLDAQKAAEDRTPLKNETPRKAAPSGGIGRRIMKTLSGWRPGQWVALTAGLCVVVFAATIGIGSFYPRMGSKSANSVATTEGAMMDREMAMPQAAPAAKGGADQAGIAEMPVVPPVSDGSVAPEDMVQKIIYTAYMSIEVNRYDAAAGTLKAAVAEAGGYLTREEKYMMDDQGRMAGNLSLRIPSAKFPELLEKAGALGKVTNQSNSAQDVTTEFVDVEARLRVMEAKEDRLLELLKQAGSMTDVLAVEQELGNTRSEIESLKGRLRYLSNQTDYSTLNVNLIEKPAAASSIQVTGLAGLWLRVKEAFLMGVNGVIGTLSDLVVWIVRVSPAILVLGMVLWVVWRKWLKGKLKSRRPDAGGHE